MSAPPDLTAGHHGAHEPTEGAPRSHLHHPGVAALRRVRARARHRVLLTGLGLAAGVVVAGVATIALGDYPLPPGDVLAALVGAGTPRTELVVVRLRLPRALAGLLVGAALGLAGALFQRLLRNPLASPDVVGVGAGASTGAVLAFTVLGLGSAGTSVAAVVGAAATAVLVVVLARRPGAGRQGVRFVLVGVGVSAALLAVVSFLMTRASLTTAQQTLLWLTGSLNDVTWTRAAPPAVACAVLVPLALVGARALPRLELGDEIAASLGLPVARVRLGLVAVAVLLVGVAVAVAGPVSFVALVSGPVAARLTRAGGPTSLPHAALVGALLVLVADLVARHLLGPVPLPVGVVTGVIGAPYLLWLLARARRTGAT